MTAQTKAFDPAVTTAGGDLWQLAVNPSELTSLGLVAVNPGQTVTIDVTITPSAAPNTVVQGTLYLDDAYDNIAPYGFLSGNELAAFPYEYTVASGG